MVNRREFIRIFGVTLANFVLSSVSESTKTFGFENKVGNHNFTETILTNAHKADILFFGEAHQDKTDNAYVADLLPRLVELDYFHIGVEIDSSYQTLIDHYVHNGLKNSLYTIPKIEKLFGILDAAMNHNIHIHCIDESPPGTRDDGRVTCQWGSDRNFKMSRNLEKRVFENPAHHDNKAIVFVGDWHAAKKSNIFNPKAMGQLHTPMASYLSRNYEVYSILLRKINQETNSNWYDLDLSNENFGV